MTFDQWWARRERSADMRLASPDGRATYRALMHEAWDAAHRNVADYIDSEWAKHGPNTAVDDVRIFVAP